jgi:hypothetical protein
MDERMRFVIRLKDGESMASLCREFGISRKTGYKIFESYEQCGLEGLSDRAPKWLRRSSLRHHNVTRFGEGREQSLQVIELVWRPQGDSNPRYRRERAMS